jgi:hypothetical protein
VFLVVTASNEYMACFERFDDAVAHARKYSGHPYPQVIQPELNSYRYRYLWIRDSQGVEMTEKQLDVVNVMFSYKHVLTEPAQYRKALARIKESNPEKYAELMQNPIIRRRFGGTDEPGTSDQREVHDQAGTQHGTQPGPDLPSTLHDG